MRKIRFWELWDWNSIGLITGILVLIFSIFLYSGKASDLFRKEKFSGATFFTEGQVDFIKAIPQMHQSRYSGNKIMNDYYEVKYAYKVDGYLFLGSEKISNNNANNNFLEKFLNGKTKKLTIEVQSSDYTKSQIVIEN